MSNERIEKKIEDALVAALDEDLDEEQVTRLEHKVLTIRKLAADGGDEG